MKQRYSIFWYIFLVVSRPSVEIQKQKKELAELANRLQFLEHQHAKNEPLLRERLNKIENKDKEEIINNEYGLISSNIF